MKIKLDKETRRRAREAIGMPPVTRKIANKKRKKEKHKKLDKFFERVYS